MTSILQDLIRQIKREAKAMARDGNGSHMEALERLARQHGHASWHALQAAARREQLTPANSLHPVRFAIDPKHTESYRESDFQQRGFTREWDWRPPGEDTWEQDGVFDFFRFEGRQPATVQEVLEIASSLFWFSPDRVWMNGVELPAVTRMEGKLGVIELPERDEPEPRPEQWSRDLPKFSALGEDWKYSGDAPPSVPKAKSVLVRARQRQRTRSVEVVVGREYLVEPLNPAKLKHRGRKCTVLELIMDEKISYWAVGARVRFHDNNRRGRVELDDLIPLDDVV